ncbi:helix-turn-helix domain-containing protein [Labilibaculum euxinus]|uniref:AAA family ATPase n=1 Tax=Labilibaculum euxinus TaxID=2686357 RepID=A0A7M4DBJ3_9BACT|nr:helix-turn-helix domain-containing protein [Labilibaculum euxinus]MUP40022.1 AAA family ATPase [Labilibaculum euxinus]MVB09227.1 AAA family ATPase [Labilibaculum euxinus]
MESNSQLDLAHKFVRFTNTTIFLTGKAGTGKTTFLRQLKEELPKRMVVVAPTGVAAINAGGVTIHSFFQLPFGPIMPGQILNEDKNPKTESNSPIRKYRKEKIDIIKSLDLLIIDEISMVRADLLDGIDEVLRKFKNRNLPFGGVQVLMIGDLQQLPPVVKNEEWSLLRNHYETPFFFSSRAFLQSQHISIELTHVYRQKDESFIKILNEIRNNQLSQESYTELEKRYLPDFKPTDKDGYITLTTHNARAQKINEEKLKQLKGKSQQFKANITGIFPEYSFPTEEQLQLKTGAQVMFVKNDSSPEKLYFNGKIGTVTGFGDDVIHVKCETDNFEIDVYPEDWHNINYSINPESKEIEETISGGFSQFPLKLAWAITIHKSQGLTFERAVIDANAAFAHGQVYVALSRCKSLEGLVLKSTLSKSGIICDNAVSKFTQNIEANPPGEENLENSIRKYQFQLLEELFSFHDIYRICNYCNKHLQDNRNNIQGNLADKMNAAFPFLGPEILVVGEKFIPSVKRYCADNQNLHENKEAQERISKASAYFVGKLEEHLQPILKDFSFDTDNQNIKKVIEGHLKQLNEKLSVKLVSLKSCLKKFDTANYQTVRAKAHFEKQSFRLKSPKEVVDENVKHPNLFRTLKKWRKNLADKINAPVYYIASQQSLVDIANNLPYTTDQLKAVKGFGKKKIEHYGADVIKMVTEYRQGQNLGLLNFTSAEPKKIIKSGNKQDTKEISLELYKNGRTVREISAFRDLTVTTIDKHLAHYVGLGMLPLDKFVEKKKIKKIKKQLEKEGVESLNECKQELGSDYSYSEIRYVQAYLKNANAK